MPWISPVLYFCLFGLLFLVKRDFYYKYFKIFALVFWIKMKMNKNVFHVFTCPYACLYKAQLNQYISNSSLHDFCPQTFVVILTNELRPCRFEFKTYANRTRKDFVDINVWTQISRTRGGFHKAIHTLRLKFVLCAHLFPLI